MIKQIKHTKLLIRTKDSPETEKKYLIMKMNYLHSRNQVSISKHQFQKQF